MTFHEFIKEFFHNVSLDSHIIIFNATTLVSLFSLYIHTVTVIAQRSIQIVSMVRYDECKSEVREMLSPNDIERKDFNSAFNEKS